MQISVTSRPPAARADDLIVLLDPSAARELFDPARTAALPGWDDLARHRKTNEVKCPYQASGGAPLLYLPGAIAPYWDDDEKIRILGGKTWDLALDRHARRIVLMLDGRHGPDAAPLAAEGLALRAYRFTKYKKGAEPKREPSVTLVVSDTNRAAVGRAVKRRLTVIESVNAARDLVNEPGSALTPADLEQAARAVARRRGLKITVLNEPELRKQGYNGLLTVGRGGTVPPRMIILRYQPAGRGARKDVHLGLLGKGVTFDTGGISIKPSARMWEMKGDMGGAAAALFAMDAIAQLKPAVAVTAILVTAQNYVDRNSVLPGDIFVAKNGKTVHVDNTDAEGRLILSDGLCRMGEERVTHLVDAATLTGAVVRALGPALTGVLGNDQFADEVIEIAATQGEPCWRLPLVEEYRQWLDIEVADLNNISNPACSLYAGATTAALFLREFVPQGVHWAHLDIAGTSLVTGQYKYFRPGATGVMVRTMAALAERLAARPADG
ncbi:MAG TPA: leucyl aminopeptidase [Candidatus Sumerlaeota bacterium]|nr:leucyl aminopeptidase [Candidatus Sumerlaeota bacterium]